MPSPPHPDPATPPVLPAAEPWPAGGPYASYGVYARRLDRPGVLTAAGVVSIIVACLSVAAGAGTGLFAVGVMHLKRQSAVMAKAAAASAAANAQPYPTTGPAGDGAEAPAPPAPGSATSPPSWPSPTDSALSPSQAQSVVQKIQSAAGGRLNPAQLAALTTALQAPGQELVPPGAVWSPVSLAQIQPDGSAVVKLSGAYVVLDVRGRIVQQFSSCLPAVAVDPLAIALVVCEALVSLALAVFLLVSGILTFTGSRWSGRFHLTYAVVKIPLSVAGGIGLAWVSTGLFNSFAGVVSPNASSNATTWAVVLTVAGVLYPVALLVTFLSPTVRDYYRGVA